MWYSKYGKRIIDLISAMLMILLFSPIMSLTALLVRVQLGTPVIFKQIRPGKDGKTFVLYKFRSMTDEKDEAGRFLPDEKRLTRFGRNLRSSSLDELPELFNILKGDMSLVGPRPLLLEYLDLYSERQKHRHDVRPGLTGLAQVMGRNSVSWEERFQYDLDYVNHVSLKNDLIIIWMTIGVVIKRKGIHSNTSETMEPFGRGCQVKKNDEIKESE